MKKNIKLYLGMGLVCAGLMGQAQIKGIPPELVPLPADSYEQAKPWVVWYFMHASYSKEGITADLKAMAENHIAGAYFTPIKGKTDPPLFEPALETLTPEWWDMFRYVVSEAKKYGVQIAMFPTDGFATAGGPWITPEKSMQKVVSADTLVLNHGGGKLRVTLPEPEKLYNYYEDIQLYAVPLAKRFKRSDAQAVQVTSSYAEDLSRLAKAGNQEKFSTKEAGWIQFAFDEPFPANAIDIERRANNYAVDQLRVLVSDDGVNFKELTKLKGPRTGWLDWDYGTTHTIPYTRAKYFRFEFDPEGSEPGSEDLDAAKWKPSINLIGITLLEEPRIHQFEGKSGKVWRVSQATEQAAIPQENIWASKDMIPLPADALVGDVLQTELPAGDWKIIRMGHTTTGHRNETAGAGKGLECDKLDADVVAFQFEQWFGKAYEMVGPELAKDVLTVYHIDSWESGSQNWTKRLPEEFLARRGYALTTYLPVLSGYVVNSVVESEAFLHDYRETIAELLQEKGFQTLHDKAKEYGVDFTAETTAPMMVGDGLAHFGLTDRPMGEFWLRSPSHDKPNDILDAISAANIYGKNTVMSEAFTQIRAQWDEHPRLLKSLQDRNYALGINELVYHVYVHNPWMDRKPGMTMDGIGLYFQRDQTWWKPGKAWVDYGIRAQQLLQYGKPVRDVAVFTGEEVPRRAILPDRLVHSLPGIIGDARVARTHSLNRNEGWPTQKIAGVTTSANMYRPEDWVDPLRGYAYDSFNPEVLLNHARVEDGSVVFSDYIAFKVLVVPGKHLLNPIPGQSSLPVLQKFNELLEAGATILFNEAPTRLLGLGTAQDSMAFDQLRTKLFEGLQQEGTLQTKVIGKGKLYVGTYQAENFAALGLQEDLVVDHKHNRAISWNHRRFEGGDSYFVANQDSAARTVHLSFRTVAPHVYLYDVLQDRLLPVKATQQAGRTEVDVNFEPLASYFVLFSDKKVDLPAWEATSEEVLSGTWQVKLQDHASEAWTVDTPEFWTNKTEDELRYHSGSGTYSLSFNQARKVKGRVMLKLDKVEAMAEIRLNGKEVGVIWTDPLQIDVTDYLIKGENKLEIKVYNTWANRFAYEATHESAEKTLETTATAKFIEGLQAAGLQGAVKLIWYKQK